MKKINAIAMSIYLGFLLFATPVYSQELAVRSPLGTEFILEVQPEDSFCSVMGYLEHLFECERVQLEELDPFLYIEGNKASPTLSLDFSGQIFSSEKGSKSKPRDYYATVTPSQKEDIAFIVNTLGQSSWSTIIKSKSSLKDAGKRIDRVHPLNFLACIFTDEKMRVSIVTMQDKSKAWKDFFKGLKDSLDEEASLNNLTPFVQDFAARVGITPSLVSAQISEGRWKDFVNTLINQFPRTGQTGRYDM